MNYDGYTDEELIGLLRDGDERVTDLLIEKYKKLVKMSAGSMYILGADREDLIQEGMIGLFKAVRDYDPGRDASFATFAGLCISRQMYTAVKNSARQKHIPLNAYVSLYANDDDTEGSVKLIDELAAETTNEPESRIIAKEDQAQLFKIMDEVLSPLERSVLDLHITGMGYLDIARVLGRDPKSTDNALSRAKSKLKKALGKDKL